MRPTDELNERADRYATSAEELVARGIASLLAERLPLEKLTPRMITCLQAAERLSVDHGQGHIGVEHVVLAALQDGDSVPAQLADEGDLSREMFIDLLASMIASDGYNASENPYHGDFLGWDAENPCPQDHPPR